jgi:hypothetical protein
MATASITEFEDLPDDSRWVYEALARLEFGDYANLSTADQSLVLGLALHLKRVSERTIPFQS